MKYTEAYDTNNNRHNGWGRWMEEGEKETKTFGGELEREYDMGIT